MTDAGRLAFHRFLLRVSGRVPDELVCLARWWLAAGRVTEVAQALSFAALAGQFLVTEAEARLLTRVLAAAGEEYVFVAGLPQSGTGETLPCTATGADPAGEDAGSGAVDRAAMEAVASAAGPGAKPGSAAIGIWRAWRVPALRTLHPPVKRVYLIQARTDAVALAARVQYVLAAEGETDPLVEVFAEPAELSEFSRRALGCAELLWAAQPAAPVRLAAAFDTFDPDGTPAFATGRPQLSGTETAQVLAYLEAGVALLASPDRAPDGLDPARAEMVPMGLRGDGRWIWSDACGYYLTRYGIAPDPELLAAIREADYVLPTVDAVAVHRSRAALLTGLAPLGATDPVGG